MKDGRTSNTHGPYLLTGGREQVFGFDALSGERTNVRVTIVLIVRVSRNLATSCGYRNIWQLHSSEFIQPSLRNGADVRSGPRAWIVSQIIYPRISVKPPLIS